MGDKLTTLDENEMWDVVHALRPDLSREQFEQMWHDFQQRKASGQLNAH